MSIDVNHEMIQLARESRGMTQGELAKRVGITQGKLSKIEGGIQGISDEILQSLSGVLGYPERFFAQTHGVYPPSMHYHRKRSSLSKKDINRITANANIQRMHLVKLLKSVDLPANNVPKLKLEEYDGSPGEVAIAVRQAFMLPRGPVDNVMRVLEDAGVIVLLCDFGTKLMDGFRFVAPDIPPTLFINKGFPGDRMRFTLAHELGHLVMHRYPSDTMEPEANEFAAEFLMPGDDIKVRLRRANLETLARLKPYWKVSMQALLYRAYALRAISERESNYLWAQIGRLGYRTKEPAELEIPPEKPSTLPEVISLHREELQYTIEELCELLLCTPQDFKDFYMEDSPRLRLVKGGGERNNPVY